MDIQNGYFGKLPDRADFVIGRCPEGFLRHWEPFLMKGLAQSRQDLGSAWEETYMTMPVWRFWLVPEIEGGTMRDAVAGALMPSVDKVGRKFPLTVASPARTGDDNGRPEEAWYDRVETVLLDVLDEESSLQAFQQAVATLEDPSAVSADDPSLAYSTLAAAPETDGKIQSFFWCRAGDQFFGFQCSGLPDAEAFRWLLLPEEHGEDTSESETAGHTHGRYHPEDNRT
ncbi:type VI secretion system-associated protein TagF [Roseibium sp. MMSF_3544]|uniref:type VI secretion system-associated protein TagF n=1 Tax=unclassified Roseibium TaxID=2629323 RepID=UPI00273D4A86|nr:type VI secretion system-associated protein TagF [Roseibium sp. MMSF_3544]